MAKQEPIPTVFVEKPKNRLDKAKDIGLVILTIISMTGGVFIAVGNERTNTRLNQQDEKLERFAKEFRDEQEYTRTMEYVTNKNVAAAKAAWDATGQKKAATLLVGFVDKVRADMKAELKKQAKEKEF